MTLQRAVSAHAAAGVLVIRRLESMQSHANSRQADSSCIVCLSLARSGTIYRPKKGQASSLMCQSCSDIAVKGGERERERSDGR